MKKNGNILLDTNVIIDLFASDPLIKDKLDGIEEIFIPCIVLGEALLWCQKIKT